MAPTRFSSGGHREKKNTFFKATGKRKILFSRQNDWLYTNRTAPPRAYRKIKTTNCKEKKSMDKKSAISYIKSQPPTFLQRAKKKGYICPSCGNGSGEDGDGIDIHRGHGHYKCFKCGIYVDILDLYGIYAGINDFPTKLSEAAKYYEITID